ncbi:MAG: flagellar basal body rod protein FlgF [Gammaproteobacteria bacterium]|nr:flagellar basal body rod protein FlgF [Gammaproteobacteria bacterium]MDH5800527.1 flagellar basal body rod protein FlgF [Gammaproteobacteria bacterium]
MDRVLYVAMSGAKQTLLAQQANNNNLANVSTTGFLSDLNAFRSMQAFGEGYPSRVFAITEKPGVDFQKGALISTGRELDIAVSNDGWISVQSKEGSEAYTRAGDLRLEQGGLLVTGTGLPVLGNGGPIILPPGESITIGNDGSISIRPPGSNTLAVVDRIRLVKGEPKDLVKGLDGLIRHKDGIALQADASIRVASGTLESSNVNVVEAMVNMISLARSYETQVKVMKEAQEMDAATDQLLKLS